MRLSTISWLVIGALLPGRPAEAALSSQENLGICSSRAASAGRPGKRAPMTSQEIVDSLIAHEHVRLGPGEI
ncbi:MAG: hypothetical protein SPK80_05275, partial [Bacteroidales bacterium]|nr:hypothetical protein [Bacteroidales bacterium]